MAKTIVGVDIGSSAVRAVEVSGYQSAHPSITRFHEMPLPDGSVRRGEVIEVSTVATALRRLWSTAGFRSRDVVLGMGGQRVFARDLSVPRAGLQQIRESLPFHVQELLPVPVADVLLDFYPIEEEAGETCTTPAGAVTEVRIGIDTEEMMPPMITGTPLMLTS